MTMSRLNIVVVAAVLVMAAGFCFGLAVPGTRELRFHEQRVAEELRRLQDKQRQLDNITELYARVMELDAKDQDYRRKLPRERQFGEFLDALSQSLRAVGLEQYEMEPAAALALDAAKLPAGFQPARKIRILPVHVTFDGTFAQTFDFLRRAESMTRISHVESLKLRNDGPVPGRVRVELVLHTFHCPE